MAHNKAKLIEAAQKFLQQGKITQAIGEYQQILKQEPRDQVILMTVGDLLVRQGETFQALEFFELYVQQGVMSEARPLYLQMAEAHLKAGRQAQGAALLRRLLEAEPDNLRVQIRMAELCVAMGQSGEAVEAYRSAGQRLLEHGDYAEALRLVGRALELEPKHAATLLLKATPSITARRTPWPTRCSKPARSNRRSSCLAKSARR